MNCRTGLLTGLCSMFCRESPPPLSSAPLNISATLIMAGWTLCKENLGHRRQFRLFVWFVPHPVRARQGTSHRNCWQLLIFFSNTFAKRYGKCIRWPLLRNKIVTGASGAIHVQFTLYIVQCTFTSEKIPGARSRGEGTSHI